MDTIKQLIEGHAILMVIVGVLSFPALCFFLFWTLAKVNGMTMLEYAKKRRAERTSNYHGGSD